MVPVYIYSHWSVYSIYILGLPCVVHLSVGDLARAPDVAGARCPLTPRPPSVAAFRCPLPPRVEVTLARCRAAAHRRAVYANLARAPAGTGLRPSAGFALPRWRSLVARRADGGLCRVAPCGDHARVLPCRRPPTRYSGACVYSVTAEFDHSSSSLWYQVSPACWVLLLLKRVMVKYTTGLHWSALRYLQANL